MPPGYKLPGSFYDLFFYFYVLNFYNDFPKCGSFLIYITWHLVEPSILNLFFSLEKIPCFVFLILFILSFQNSFSWMPERLNSSLHLLSFPFLFLLIPSSRKQTRWYLLILRLRFFSMEIWFLTQSSTLLHPMSMKRKALLQPWVSFQIAPVLHFLLGSFSLGFLSDSPSCVSPLFSAQEIPEQYFVSNHETSLDPTGARHHVLLQHCYNQMHLLSAGHGIKNTRYITATDFCVKLTPFI